MLAKKLDKTFTKYQTTLDKTNSFVSEYKKPVEKQEEKMAYADLQKRKNKFSSDDFDELFNSLFEDGEMEAILKSLSNTSSISNAQKDYQTKDSAQEIIFSKSAYTNEEPESIHSNQPFLTDEFSQSYLKGQQTFSTSYSDLARDVQQNIKETPQQQEITAYTNSLSEEDPKEYFNQQTVSSTVALFPVKSDSNETVRQETEPTHQRTSLVNEHPHSALENYNNSGKKHAINKNTQESRITDKQLRALNRKHLLMMIRDLEKELAQEKKEKENLLVNLSNNYHT